MMMQSTDHLFQIDCSPVPMLEVMIGMYNTIIFEFKEL